MDILAEVNSIVSDLEWANFSRAHKDLIVSTVSPQVCGIVGKGISSKINISPRRDIDLAVSMLIYEYGREERVY
jgi:hypothetical protein